MSHNISHANQYNKLLGLLPKYVVVTHMLHPDYVTKAINQIANGEKDAVIECLVNASERQKLLNMK